MQAWNSFRCSFKFRNANSWHRQNAQERGAERRQHGREVRDEWGQVWSETGWEPTFIWFTPQTFQILFEPSKSALQQRRWPKRVSLLRHRLIHSSSRTKRSSIFRLDFTLIIFNSEMIRNFYPISIPKYFLLMRWYSSTYFSLSGRSAMRGSYQGSAASSWPRRVRWTDEIQGRPLGWNCVRWTRWKERWNRR